MYFTEPMFDPAYINPLYFKQQQAQMAQYNSWQDQEVCKADHAAKELCRAVKNMDAEHQRVALLAFLLALGEEFGWGN